MGRGLEPTGDFLSDKLSVDLVHTEQEHLKQADLSMRGASASELNGKANDRRFETSLAACLKGCLGLGEQAEVDQRGSLPGDLRCSAPQQRHWLCPSGERPPQSQLQEVDPHACSLCRSNLSVICPQLSVICPQAMPKQPVHTLSVICP